VLLVLVPPPPTEHQLKKKHLQPLIPPPPTIILQDKIEAIARSYGAAGVSYSHDAEAQIAKYTKMGFGNLPICMAKTQYSFSHDAKLKGAPGLGGGMLLLGFALPWLVWWVIRLGLAWGALF